MASSGSFKTNGYEGRYLTFSWSISSQDIANNKTIIKYSLKGDGNALSSWYYAQNFKLVIAGKTVYSSSSTIKLYKGTTVCSGTVTIPHNSDGTKSFSASAQAGIYTSAVNCKGSDSWNLTTIPRASKVNTFSGNIGEKVKISISRASSSFVHTLTYNFGSLSGTIGSNLATSVDWSIPTEFYAQMPNQKEKTGTITCKTYSGTKLIGSSTCNFTAKVVNSNPIFNLEQVSYLDSNNDVVNITNDNQIIVRNNSNLQVAFTKATPQNSASIEKYELKFNNTVITKNEAGTVDYGIINLSQNSKIIISAIDTRGNYTSVEKEIIICDWSNPTAVINANRINNFEDTTKFIVQSTIAPVNGKNSIVSIKYRYKKVNDTIYSNYSEISDNTETILTIDNNFAWNFEIIVTDKFGSTTYLLIVAKGIPILFIDVIKLAVGINKFPTQDNALELGGDLILQSGNPVLDYDVIINNIFKFKDNMLLDSSSIVHNDEKLSHLLGKNKCYVLQGGMVDSGNENEVLTRIKTTAIWIKPNTTYTIKADSNLMINVNEFTKNSWIKGLNYSNAGEEVVFTTSSNGSYIRLGFHFEDNRNISPDDLTGITINGEEVLLLRELDNFYDTGWIMMKLTNCKADGIFIPKYKLVGKTLYIRGSVVGLSGVGKDIYNFPELFRVSNYNHLYKVPCNSTNTGTVTVYTNGNLRITNTTATMSTSIWFVIDTTVVLD